MMHAVNSLFASQPLIALFVTVALGYLLGKIRIKTFVLGGVAGTLIVGVVIGQIGIDLDPGIKTIFFALFIYAVGFQGGPQFARALNRRSLNQLASAFVMCLMGLVTVIVGARLFGLDRGLAAGLAAGGLTQSAIIGTAGDAIGKLGLPAAVTQTMQTNVAVGYAVTYIFGSLGPILMVTWLLPMLMKWDIRQEALKLARTLSGGRPELEPGEFDAITPIATRVYTTSAHSAASGKTTLDIDRALRDGAVESVTRVGTLLPLTETTTIHAEDEVAFTGSAHSLALAGVYFGEESTATDARLVEENREIVLTNRALVDRDLGAIRSETPIATQHGVFLTQAKRMGHELPLLPKLTLHRGDKLHFVGRSADLDRVQPRIGYKISAGSARPRTSSSSASA